MVDPTTVGAALLLVAAFILSLKILKTAVETLLVAAISGAFYAVMAVSLGYPVNLDSIATFAAAGTVLYVLYSVVLPLMRFAWTGAKAPFKLVSWFGARLKSLKEEKRMERLESMVRSHEEKLEEDEEDGEVETKEVVLDKVAREDED
ncbi:MAG: hypothetical protein ABEJ03_05975 [Candidatus Nanohaloarchaea archaeon]